MIAAEPAAEFSPVNLQLRDGLRITMRAVRPQDKDELQAALKRLSDTSRYARFMSPLRELSPQMLERATNPEGSRELQLVAIVREGAQEKIIGGARYAAGVGSTECEFAVAVTESCCGWSVSIREFWPWLSGHPSARLWATTGCSSIWSRLLPNIRHRWRREMLAEFTG